MVALEDFDEAQLVEFFRKKFGKYTTRALSIIPKFGPHDSITVAKIVFCSYHNLDKRKLPEVLDLLEKHYEEYLKFQPEQEVGKRSDILSPTEALLVYIYEKILGIHVIMAFPA